MYENEPEIHPGLVGNEKVILLPHMGTWTVETQEKMECWCVENVRDAMEGGVRSGVPEQRDVEF